MRAYALAFVAVLVALAGRGLLWPVLGSEFPFLFFFGAVMVAAWRGGLGPGLVATVLSAILSIAFLMTERLETPGARVPALAALGGFVVIGTLMSALSEALRRSRTRTQTSEAHLRQLVEHAPAPIAMLDRDLRYVVVSRRWLTDYRLGDSDLAGRSHYEVFPEVPARWKEVYARCLAGAIERSDEDPFPRADGTVDWVRWEVRPWRDERGAIGGIFIYSENIAARKRFEEELSKKTEELETALHARDIFLSVASHELRTPLTPLMLQLQSLRMQAERSNGDPLPTAKVIDKLQKSERQVTHLVRLVENLLDVSRLAEKRLALDLTTFELGALVQEVIDRLKPEFERTNTPVEAKLDPTVRGEWDRARVDQVVMNLLGNALKYGHGKLVEVEVSARDGDALLVVRDRGIGISAEDQKRIFGRFERAVSEKNYGGFGLGLWISIQLLEAMRGKIEVDSEVGAGATFRVVLPATSLSRG